MASRIKAIQTFRARIDRGATVQRKELLSYLTDRTGVNEGEVDLVLDELRDSLIFFSRGGRGVKLRGLGTFLPSMKINGRFSVSLRLDQEIKNALNMPGFFIGRS